MCDRIYKSNALPISILIILYKDRFKTGKVKCEATHFRVVRKEQVPKARTNTYTNVQTYAITSTPMDARLVWCARLATLSGGKVKYPSGGESMEFIQATIECPC